MRIRSRSLRTPLGSLFVSWSDVGLREVRLREAPASRRPGEERGQPAAREPRWVREALRKLERHIAGQAQDFSGLPLDLDQVPGFHRRVYEAARGVPPGSVVTYGDLALRVGRAGAARAVGQAMARNPLLLVVPCHRVVGAGGRLGGFSAPGGTGTKSRLLEIEGARPGSPEASAGRGPGRPGRATARRARRIVP
jgi:methylated-DNA-[protein]-cysteine S-methyltransferase